MSDGPGRIPEWGRPMATWSAGVRRPPLADASTRSAIIGLFLLETAPDLQALRSRIDRVTRWFPALRQRPVAPVGSIGAPRMVVDPSFDVSFHVVRYVLPAPGSWEQIMDHVQRQSDHDLDQHRPLWRATLVEGLDDGQAVLLLCVHPSIADGQGAVMMLAGLAEPDAEQAGEAAPMPPVPSPGRTDPVTASLSALAAVAKRAGGLGLQAVRDIPGSARTLAAHPRRSTADAFRVAAAAAQALRNHRAPLSPLLQQRGDTHATRTMDVPFAALRRLGIEHGASLTEVLLAALLAGARRYHEAHRTSVGQLRVSVPVLVDGATVCMARVELDAALVDGAARVRQIHEAIARVRRDPTLPVLGRMSDASRLLPVDLLARDEAASDMTLCNVPGLPAPARVAGARLDRLYPVLPAMGAAVGVAVLSYAREHCSIGLTMDEAAVVDPDQLVACLADGFADTGARCERVGSRRV